MSPELQAWIEEQKPELVEAAERYVAESEIYLPTPQDQKKGGRRSKDPRVTGSQLRNLLNVALTERSLAVLKNFLRYQVGRQWKDGKAGDLLEQLLLREIANRSQARGKAEGVSPREIEAALLPLLLGYIIREYTYRCKLAGTRSHG